MGNKGLKKKNVSQYFILKHFYNMSKWESKKKIPSFVKSKTFGKADQSTTKKFLH